MEDKGLGYLEDTACGIFTGPAAPFCAWAFNSPMGQYVNKEIENIPLIKHTANWIANTANEYVPSGARNVIDDVADAYNTATNFENQCKSANVCENLWKSAKSISTTSVLGKCNRQSDGSQSALRRDRRRVMGSASRRGLLLEGSASRRVHFSGSCFSKEVLLL